MSSQTRLSAVRKQQGLTQVEFAARLGITSRAYLNYESGLREAPASVLYRLVTEFDLDPGWVLCGSDNIPRSRSAQAIDRDKISTAMFEILEYARKQSRLPQSDKIVEATMVHLYGSLDVESRAKQVIRMAA